MFDSVDDRSQTARKFIGTAILKRIAAVRLAAEPDADRVSR
jgi:hypothetical protein